MAIVRLDAVFHPSVLCYRKSEDMYGRVSFTQTVEGNIVVGVELRGFPPGLHGMHIHEKALTSEMLREKGSKCCQELGPHFNGDSPIFEPIHSPDGTKHGHHLGDLAFNVSIDENGNADYWFCDKRIGSLQSILGRSLVIHADADDMGVLGLQRYENSAKEIESYKTGNAGARIACTNIMDSMY